MRFLDFGAFIIAQFIQFHVASPFAGITLSSDRLGKHGVIHERGNMPPCADICLPDEMQADSRKRRYSAGVTLGSVTTVLVAAMR